MFFCWILTSFQGPQEHVKLHLSMSRAGDSAAHSAHLSSSDCSSVRVFEFSCAAVAEAPEAARALVGSEARATSSVWDVHIRTGLSCKLAHILLPRPGYASEAVGVAWALDGYACTSGPMT